MKYNIIITADPENYFNDPSVNGIAFDEIEMDDIMYLMKLAFTQGYEVLLSQIKG